MTTIKVKLVIEEEVEEEKVEGEVEEEVEEEKVEGENEDISQNNIVCINYELSNCKKWIKLLPIKKTILFNEYNRKEYFMPIATVVLDDELFATGKKTGQKKRNTLIQFIPMINADDFMEKTEWLYIYS